MTSSKPFVGRLRALCLVASFAFAALLLFSRPDAALTHSGDAFDAPFGTASIDGRQGPGEWDDALEIPVFGDALPGSTLFVMVDAYDIFIALRVSDATQSFDDIFEIRFDGAHNGVLDDGDDSVALTGDSVFSDSHYEAAGPFYLGDASSDGAGVTTGRAGFNFFEISHPLNSGDDGDLAVAPGDTIGICLRYFLDGTNTSGMTFPRGCFLASNEQSLYADLTLATPLPCRLGDVNGDRAANSLDALRVLQLVAALVDSLPCQESADVNEDGDVNSIDANLILQYDAGLIDRLPP